MLKKKRGLIVVISAPSGVGKTTLLKRFLQVSPSFTPSVSFTTRHPRKNEIEGVDYYFVSLGEFQKMREEGKFVEWAEVHGQLYGTSINFLNEVIKTEKDVILEVDVKGGTEIRKKYPQAVLIFLLPPSWQELQRRLSGRATEETKKIRDRMQQAKKEIKYISFYDYVIMNDNINRALGDLLAIIKAERCQVNKIPPENLKKLT